MYVDPLTERIRGLPADLQRLILSKTLELHRELRRAVKAHATQDMVPTGYCLLVRRTTGKPRDFRVVQDYDFKRVKRPDGYFSMHRDVPKVPVYYASFHQKFKRVYEYIAAHAHPDVIPELADLVLTRKPEDYLIVAILHGRILNARVGTYSTQNPQEFHRDCHLVTAHHFDPDTLTQA